jgi:hypothetical protein
MAILPGQLKKFHGIGTQRNLYVEKVVNSYYAEDDEPGLGLQTIFVGPLEALLRRSSDTINVIHEITGQGG